MSEQTAKFPEDQLGKFIRLEVDRGIVPYSREFIDENKTPLIGVALEISRKQRSIDILDAGCGTGRALYELVDQLDFRTPDPKTITGTGINDVDLSKESELVAVRKAISEGTIKYIVGDLDEVTIPTEQYDLVTCYETLIHNENDKVSSILKKLFGSVKPTGVFYFNLEPDQRSDKEIKEFIDKAKEENTVFEYEKEDKFFGAKRTFVMIRKTPKRVDEPTLRKDALATLSEDVLALRDDVPALSEAK